jgi:hypothetical protein
MSAHISTQQSSPPVVTGRVFLRIATDDGSPWITSMISDEVLVAKLLQFGFCEKGKAIAFFD